MRILIACETSGAVRDAFRRRGHDAISCDLLPTEVEGPHYQGDVTEILYAENWDMIIAHPPCTYLASSGLHWNARTPGREQKTNEAIEFARLFFAHRCKKKAIENPVGLLSTVFRKPDQIIQPYDFGSDASKGTCLWLTGLPLLRPTNRIPPGRMVHGRPRWANQTDTGQDRTSPSPDRWKERSRTHEGVALAMAAQWSTAPEPLTLF